MSLGMSYADFWHGDVNMARAYRKADEMKRRRENEALWTQGLYFRDALLCTVGNMFSSKTATKFEYPKEPYPVTSEQVAEAEERKRKNREDRIKAEFAAFAASVERRIGRNGE